MSVPVADLFDHFEAQLSLCELEMRDFGGITGFAGPIATVSVCEENKRVRDMLSTPGEGRVLVVDRQGSTARALVGDQLAALGANNGWAGVIVNGAIRDVVGLAGIALGIKALATNPKPPSKTGAGETDVPVSFGGVTFRPGEWVYADVDGVAVSAGQLKLPKGG